MNPWYVGAHRGRQSAAGSSLALAADLQQFPGLKRCRTGGAEEVQMTRAKHEEGSANDAATEGGSHAGVAAERERGKPAGPPGTHGGPSGTGNRSVHDDANDEAFSGEGVSADVGGAQNPRGEEGGSAGLGSQTGSGLGGPDRDATSGLARGGTRPGPEPQRGSTKTGGRSQSEGSDKNDASGH